MVVVLFIEGMSLHDLPIFTIFKAKRHPGKVFLELSLLLEDRPGVLAEVSGVIAELGGDVKWGLIHESREEGKVWLCAFILIDRKLVGHLVDRLEGIECVINTRHTVHEEELIATKHHQAITCLTGERAILTCITGIRKLVSGLRESLGEDVLRAFAYLFGTNLGEVLVKNAKELGIKVEEGTMITILKGLGWIGEGSWRKDRDSYVFRLLDPFDMEFWDRCFLMRGIITGFLTSLKGTEYRVVDERLVGDREKEFVLKKSS